MKVSLMFDIRQRMREWFFMLSSSQKVKDVNINTVKKKIHAQVNMDLSE